jgi:membrane associated rhomboid family serine protease
LAFRHESLIGEFALIPDRALRLGGLTLVTSFFLHAGWWHLVGNLYFLIVFGDNVEEYLGRGRWLLLLLFANLAGALSHLLAEPHSSIPCIGASGGISGLLAFYAFRFPKARLGLRIWMRYSYRAPWVTFPAWAGFAVWMALQFLGVFEQMNGLSNVSAMAHLGGAAAGIVAWRVWRDIDCTKPKSPDGPRVETQRGG